MSDEPLPHSEIILYQTEDGRTRIQCRFENETLWLTQAQIAELFQTTPQNVMRRPRKSDQAVAKLSYGGGMRRSDMGSWMLGQG